MFAIFSAKYSKFLKKKCKKPSILTIIFTHRITARITVLLTARRALLTEPDGPPNGPDGLPNGPDGPPNGPDGPPNGPDVPPNSPDGPPNGPDSGAGDRRLRPWYLTRGWIMSHLYL